MRRKAERMRRSVSRCVSLGMAVTMVFCSDATGYAAQISRNPAAGTEAAENTDDSMRIAGAVLKGAENAPSEQDRDSGTGLTETEPGPGESESAESEAGSADPGTEAEPGSGGNEPGPAETEEALSEPVPTETEEVSPEPAPTETEEVSPEPGPAEAEEESTEEVSPESTEAEEVPSEPEPADTEEAPSEPESTGQPDDADKGEGAGADSESGSTPAGEELPGTESGTGNAGSGDDGGPQTEEETKGAEVPAAVRLERTCELMDIGQTIKLPGYTFVDAAPENPAVTWTVEDMGNVVLDAAAGTVRAVKAGIAFIKLQLVQAPDVSAVFQVVVRPEAPASVSAFPQDYRSVRMEWSEVPEAEGYLILRRAEKEGTYTQVADIPAGGTPGYVDSGLLTGRNYAYQIAAYVTYKDENGVLRYAESTRKATVTAQPQLGRVEIKGAQPVSAVSAEITWEPLDGADGYTVYRAEGGSADFSEAGTVTGNATSYTDSALRAGLVYRYTVAGYRLLEGSRVYGEESDEATVKPVPQAPELSVSLPDYRSVRLSWKRVEGADGYEIVRKVSGNSTFKKVKTIQKGSTKKWTDNGVDTGTKYVYRIRAFQKVGNSTIWSDYSAEQKITPTLAAPTVTLRAAEYNSLTVTWSKISGAQSYRIYRATSLKGTYKLIKSVKGNKTFRYTNTRLKPGNTYYYKVCACRTVDGETVNGIRSEAAASQVIPGAPELRAEAAGATAVRLTWNKVELPAKGCGYYVYQIVNGKEEKLATCKKSAASYVVEGLDWGQKYSFKVAAYVKNSKGRAVRGMDSNVLTASPELLPVEIQSVEPSVKGMQIVWSATEDEDEDTYLIYRSRSEKSGYKQIGKVQRRAGTKVHSFEDKEVSVGKRYYYKIRCEKAVPGKKNAKSDYSEVESAVAAPPAPVVTLKSETSTSIKLSWKAVKGTSSGGYVVYRSTSENGKYASIKKINKRTTTSFIDKGLTIGETYFYKVRAYCMVNSKEVYGPYSDVRSQKVVPATPEIEVKPVDYTTISISWKKVEGCDGYQIYKSAAADGTFKKAGTVSASKTSYEDKKVTIGVASYYKVRAYCSKNGKKVYGSYSAVKGAVPVLTKPTDLKAEMTGDTQVKLTWKAVPGAETYTILRGTSLNGTFRIASEICNTNTFTDNNAVAGNTYYYKLYAVRGEARSEMSDAVAATPSALTVSVTDVLVKTGSSVKVTATANPASVIAWTSDNPAIAMVTSDGVIYGVRAGTTKVNAIANGIKKVVNVTVRDRIDLKGPDISSDNGTVDFQAVRASGHEYVMLRISNGTTADPAFETNFINAKAAGLKVGVYCYARARTAKEAEAEASKVLQLLNGRALDYPVVYDMEEQTLLYGLSNKIRSGNLEAFRNTIVNAGKQYKFALRATTEWLTTYLENERLTGVNLWVINHRDAALGHGYTGKGTVIMWQYTDKGTVSGINGNVDLSLSYVAY